ncbi:MAG: efflux RND transporter periplasmic adaptor subunit [Bacteroidota bacterium]
MVRIIFRMIPILILLAGCGGGDGSSLSATGTIEATEVTLSAQVGGVVKLVRVDEGVAVLPGDTLAILDATDWIYQLQQAEAGFVGADAQHRLSLQAARQEDLIQAEANYKSAENDLKRMEELAPTGSISQKQLEDAKTRFTISQQTYEKMKRGSRREEIEIARARRDQAEAQVSSLRKKVNDCTILSPMQGVVTKRFIERGELVGQGMSLFRVANLAEMDLMIYVIETELPKVKLGQQAKVKVDAFPDKEFNGRVVFISSTAEFTPKNIQTKDERTKLVFGVKIKVENADGSLKSGIPADVTLQTGSSQ